jgi:hypothetical protein
VPIVLNGVKCYRCYRVTRCFQVIYERRGEQDLIVFVCGRCFRRYRRSFHLLEFA